MITGAPILVYGPADFALLEYAKEKEWGYTVTKQDAREIKKAIAVLYNDINLREKLGKKAQEVALEEHDLKKVREEFRKELCRAYGEENKK